MPFTLRHLIEADLKKRYTAEPSGHDYYHFDRVRRLALKIIRAYPRADRQVVELAALLHDVDDVKFNPRNPSGRAIKASRMLKRYGASAEVIRRVAAVIENVSFKGAGVRDSELDVEAKAVQDADRLEALGALGIARTMAFGGSRARPIYDPRIRPVFHRTRAAFLKSAKTGTTINHFYEKLLLLKDRLHTPEARRMAKRRHAFLETYLREFFRDWNVGER